MQVEDITWIGLASWWAANDQRDIAVGFGVFGQVVIDDQRIAPRLHKLFTHCAARVRSNVLHRCWLSGSRYSADSMLHRFVLLQDSLCTRHRRVILTHRHGDT